MEFYVPQPRKAQGYRRCGTPSVLEAKLQALQLSSGPTSTRYKLHRLTSTCVKSTSLVVASSTMERAHVYRAQAL